MTDVKKNEKEESRESETGTLSGSSYDAEDVLENAEPWEPIETKIVLASFGAALLALVVFGLLINAYVLD